MSALILTVTALYEITLIGSSGQRLESLRYGSNSRKDEVPYSDELAFLRLRYKAPDGDTRKLLEWSVLQKAIIVGNNSSNRFRFSASVAAFGQQLRGGKYLEPFSYDDILSLAQGSRDKDLFGYRSEFIKLVKLAQSLSHNP